MYEPTTRTQQGGSCMSQAYILLLWGCEVGLLGLGYLALLIGVFTYPPIRGRWSRLEEGGIEPDSSVPSSVFGRHHITDRYPCVSPKCCRVWHSHQP